jgi:predicted lipid-binding transport protein (Tim44 family)
MHGAFLAAGLFSVFALGGCVGASEGQTPAWFAARQTAEEEGYPSLRDVPRTSTANTDVDHWSAAEADLMAAGAALKAHPRAQQPTSAEQDPAAFMQEARGALEAARLAHEPN